MKKNNVKSKDLAKKLGLSKSAISNYTTGVSIPKAELIAKIAEIFNIKIEELLIPHYSITLNESPFAQHMFYEIPLLAKTLSSTDNITRNDNMQGFIKCTFPPYNDFKCFAVKISDNLLSISGITNKSIVIFALNSEVKDGEFAAIMLKKEKKVIIRRVSYAKNKITLSTDLSSEIYTYPNEKSNIVILGKIVSATFSPNS